MKKSATGKQAIEEDAGQEKGHLPILKPCLGISPLSRGLSSKRSLLRDFKLSQIMEKFRKMTSLMTA